LKKNEAMLLDYKMNTFLPKILISIFSFLPLKDKFKLREINSNFNQVLSLPFMWKDLTTRDNEYIRSNISTINGMTWRWIIKHCGIYTSNSVLNLVYSFQIACENGQLKEAQRLIENASNPNEIARQNDNYALISAYKNGHYDIVKWLMTRFDFKKSDLGNIDPRHLQRNYQMSDWMVGTLILSKSEISLLSKDLRAKSAYQNVLCSSAIDIAHIGYHSRTGKEICLICAQSAYAFVVRIRGYMIPIHYECIDNLMNDAIICRGELIYVYFLLDQIIIQDVAKIILRQIMQNGWSQ